MGEKKAYCDVNSDENDDDDDDSDDDNSEVEADWHDVTDEKDENKVACDDA